MPTGRWRPSPRREASRSVPLLWLGAPGAAQTSCALRERTVPRLQRHLPAGPAWPQLPHAGQHSPSPNVLLEESACLRPGVGRCGHDRRRRHASCLLGLERCPWVRPDPIRGCRCFGCLLDLLVGYHQAFHHEQSHPSSLCPLHRHASDHRHHAIQKNSDATNCGTAQASGNVTAAHCIRFSSFSPRGSRPLASLATRVSRRGARNIDRRTKPRESGHGSVRFLDGRKREKPPRRAAFLAKPAATYSPRASRPKYHRRSWT